MINLSLIIMRQLLKSFNMLVSSIDYDFVLNLASIISAFSLFINISIQTLKISLI